VWRHSLKKDSSATNTQALHGKKRKIERDEDENDRG
jgi:hypothetical protein